MRKYAFCLLMVGLGLAPVIVLASAHATHPQPLILYNPSPSEPTGFYMLSAASARTGEIIAFKVPAPGRVYADAHLRAVARSAILKEVAAGAGDLVCEDGGLVTVDGATRAMVAAADRQGVSLPHWSGCQRLKAGQYFVLSNRIPNSFDSRYYGPVTDADLIGVYRPFWTE